MPGSINPHHVPGMGFQKNQPIPKPKGILDSVAARVRCGEVELKLTLTPKLLVKTLRDALVEPFLKVHNKRAPVEVTWEQLACIKVDGITLDDMDVIAESVLKKEELKVHLVTTIPEDPLENLVAVARIEPTSYMDPPMITEELLNLARAAASSDELDADLGRRCSNAFQKISDGAETVSLANVRLALLRDEYVRKLVAPDNSHHMVAIDGGIVPEARPRARRDYHRPLPRLPLRLRVRPRRRRPRHQPLAARER